MVHVAIIGAGRWGPNLIRNFYSGTRSEVRWIIDTNEPKLASLGKRYPGVRCSTRIDDALTDAEVHAVIVATPTTTHFEVARASLAAGKHCLVEKPLTTDVQSSQHLCQLAEQTNRLLMVGHVFVHNAAVQYIKSLINAGGLGDIYYASALRTNFGPIRGDVNAAWDLAAHDISMFNYWFGAEPLTASAAGGAWINKGFEDVVFGTLRYPSGQLAHIHASWLNPQKERRLTLVGDKKMLVFDDLNFKEPIRIYDKTVTPELTDAPPFIDSVGAYRASLREGSVQIPQVSSGEPLLQECDHFLDCIAGKSDCISTGEHGLSVVRVLEAMSQSLQLDAREVNIDQIGQGRS